MRDDELIHYGVKGMKWGVRRTAEQLGHTTKKTAKKAASAAKEAYSKRKERKQSEKAAKIRKKKKVKDMTDEELREHISRMQLEKQYLELKKQTAPQRSKGSKFVEQVLTKSGDNIATQFVTYVLGTGTNKAFASVFGDPAIVNPKKGQKDK